MSQRHQPRPGVRRRRRDATREAWERATASSRSSLHVVPDDETPPASPPRRAPLPPPPPPPDEQAHGHRGASGRAVVLALVLIALMLAYAYPLRIYLAQQAEIARLEEDQRAQRERIQQLADEVARWNDDEYIKTQARLRFLLVEVGDQTYVVGHEPETTTQQGDPTSPPWYEQVWTSVQAADDPPTAPAVPSAPAGPAGP